MATVDEDLSQFERLVRQLKIEYEQYFGGDRSRPPTDTEWRAEQILKRYDGRTAEINSGQRFRYHNLMQTFAKYKEIWRKKLRKREEGLVERHYGAAARQIEAERARSRSESAKASDAASRGKKRGVEQPAVLVSCSDPEREHDKVEKLYQAMAAAHEETGQAKGMPSLADFRKFVARKTEELRKGKTDKEVEYSIAVDSGKVKLSARLKS